MLLGMTRGEIVLVVLVFAFVYGGVLIPRLGERIGVFLASRRAPIEGDPGGRDAKSRR